MNIDNDWIRLKYERCDDADSDGVLIDTNWHTLILTALVLVATGYLLRVLVAG